MAQISPARKAAYSILLKVESGEGHSDDLLRRHSVSALSQQDRNLATALVLGVLRQQIALDRQIRAHLNKPDARLDAEVRIALRLGAFQILHMDRIPARAAIDESVELAKRAGHRFASGMVNAVLRRLASSAPRQGITSGTPEEPLNCNGASAAYPEWIVTRWKQFFGDDAACEICRHGQMQHSLSIRVDDLAVEAELADAGVEFAPGAMLTHARILLRGDITAVPAFREARVRVQDEGSQLVAEIAGHANAILDCCAAPGGKTLILGQRNPDAHIVACEASKPRFETLQQRLAPLGPRVECRLADATALSFESEFHLVLADVPCSGTGTLGRNPEIRHRLEPEDFSRQAERQALILQSAMRAVRPGGRIVYATCTLEPEENEHVVAAVLQIHANASVLPIAARLDEMEREGILVAGAARTLQNSITPEGFLRLIPGAFGTDGFFVALLEKAASG
jgi:16S rRNA (cytosine967-C5)-methyltransferase